MVARGHGSTNVRTTLDRLPQRHIDTEEEFLFTKEDLKRVRAVLREKLGVSQY
jgi:hypothetical protein